MEKGNKVQSKADDPSYAVQMQSEGETSRLTELLIICDGAAVRGWFQNDKDSPLKNWVSAWNTKPRCSGE